MSSRAAVGSRLENVLTAIERRALVTNLRAAAFGLVIGLLAVAGGLTTFVLAWAVVVGILN